MTRRNSCEVEALYLPGSDYYPFLHLLEQAGVVRAVKKWCCVNTNISKDGNLTTRYKTKPLFASPFYTLLPIRIHGHLEYLQKTRSSPRKTEVYRNSVCVVPVWQRRRKLQFYASHKISRDVSFQQKTKIMATSLGGRFQARILPADRIRQTHSLHS